MGNLHDKVSKNFTVVEKLNARGAFGRIFLVRDKRDNEIYVMKKIGFRKNLLKHLGDEETLSNIKQEASLLEDLTHKHIVSYRAFWIEGLIKQQACIVMEYCSKGDLRGYLEEQFKRKQVPIFLFIKFYLFSNLVSSSSSSLIISPEFRF